MKEAATQALKQELKVKEKENIEIRDHLAMERTKLANERTLLSYLRTSMALVVAGFSLLQFFSNDVYKLAGLAFVPVGLVAGIYGIRRFMRKKQEIRDLLSAYAPTSQAHAVVAQVEAEKQQ
ncbi:MAG: DUF202 domain-containing protein [Adhaeribacter sp.]